MYQRLTLDGVKKSFGATAALRVGGNGIRRTIRGVKSTKKDRGFITTAYALGEELAPGLSENRRCNIAEKQ